MKNLSKPIVYSLYGLSIMLIVIGIIMMTKTTKVRPTKFPNAVYDVLNKVTLPVIQEENDKLMIRPYTDNNIEIVQNFYDYMASEEEQRKSIIFYQDTYMQSTGVSYKLEEEPFDVVAVLDGEVMEVKEDALLGNIVKIKHASNIISIYQSIKDITVEKGDLVEKGDRIGKSGESTMNSILGNHLYFELVIDNISVNPEEYYDQAL